MNQEDFHLIRKRPKAIFFDLSSSILDSHKIVLECIDSVPIKYGLPKWLNGSNKKKEKSKFMKENFPNFFGEKMLIKLITNIFNFCLIIFIECH